MQNLQQLIKNTKLNLIDNEQSVQMNIDKLKELSKNVLSNNLLEDKITYESAFKTILKSLSNTEMVLNNYYSNLQSLDIKNKNLTLDILSVMTPIAKMISSLKSVQNVIILAQNQSALKGQKDKADNLAKLSLELNYENHKLVKITSEKLKNIKDLMNND